MPQLFSAHLFLLLTLFSHLAPTHFLFYESEFLLVTVYHLCLAFRLKAHTISLCYCSIFHSSLLLSQYCYATLFAQIATCDAPLSPNIQSSYPSTRKLVTLPTAETNILLLELSIASTLKSFTFTT